MKVRILLVTLYAVASAFFCTVQAQTTESSNTHALQTPLMEERLSELMADRVPINNALGNNNLIEINERAALLRKESLQFPAEELYGSHWDNKSVNPFRNGSITFPDSCAIDCSTFVLPIDNEIKVTSKYGPRRRRMHRGIDLKVYIGDTIRAAFDGKVRMRSYERKGYGYYLVLRHPNGLETVYGHLSKFLVEENTIVRAGEPIALGGNTGRSSGSHLHFETRFLGKDIDPAQIIDFVNGVPHQDMYVFRNIKINGRNSNIYTANDNKMVYHRVKSGDSLGKIARMYGTSVSRLCSLNGIKSTSTLRIGQSLRVTAGIEDTQVQQTVKQNQTKAAAKPAQQKQIVVDAAVAASHIDEANKANGEPVYHKIKSGDTLGAIAKKYGTSIEKLCEINGITRTTILRLGRVLRCS